MPGEKILVVDAGQDVEKRMAAILEPENYLVYPVSSHEVTAETAEFLNPSLIYIRPLELDPTGLKPCKEIHDIPLLQKIPIIILASPKKSLGSKYFEGYGIVDFLKLTFGQEELIDKTETILGKTPPSQRRKKDKPDASPRTFKRTNKKQSLPLPAIGIVALLVIAGAGFMAYQHFMPTQRGPASLATKVHVQAPSMASKAGPKSKLPMRRNVAKAPIPASPAPSTTSRSTASLSSGSSPQPPGKPFYSVQLGAFRNEDTAQVLTKKFQEKGYNAFTQLGVTKDKTPIYRVLVNKYEDRKSAQKLAREIQSREEIKTTLYSE